MARAIFLLALVAVILVYPLSVVALHVEASIYGGWQGLKDQLSFPAVIFPAQLVRTRGYSIGLIVAAALGVFLSRLCFERFVFKKWCLVSDSEFKKVMGKQ